MGTTGNKRRAGFIGQALGRLVGPSRKGGLASRGGGQGPRAEGRGPLRCGRRSVRRNRGCGIMSIYVCRGRQTKTEKGKCKGRATTIDNETGIGFQQDGIRVALKWGRFKWRRWVDGLQSQGVHRRRRTATSVGKRGWRAEQGHPRRAGDRRMHVSLWPPCR